ncbi:hypothetical protein ANTRET_LOCUS7310 [Anthophora retusa]
MSSSCGSRCMGLGSWLLLIGNGGGIYCPSIWGIFVTNSFVRVAESSDEDYMQNFFSIFQSRHTKQLDLRSEQAGNVHATWPGFPWPNRFTPVLPLVRKHTNTVVQPLPPP